MDIARLLQLCVVAFSVHLCRKKILVGSKNCLGWRSSLKTGISRIKSVAHDGKGVRWLNSHAEVVEPPSEFPMIRHNPQAKQIYKAWSKSIKVMKACPPCILEFFRLNWNNEEKFWTWKILRKTKEILEIPDEYKVITLIMIGTHSEEIDSILSEKQVEWEKKRPERFPFEKIAHLNRFKWWFLVVYLSDWS